MITTICYGFIDSPLGPLLVQGDGEVVTGLFLSKPDDPWQIDSSWQKTDAPFRAVRAQLAEYFAGTRREFTVPIRLDGTPFQRQVWRELLRIPFGKTISYAQLAQRIGKPGASRAVGNANSRNPISIIVPCHRVIGADGKLTGYAGGIANKDWLLAWERRGQALEAQTSFDAVTM
jgi:methylated-DNA-[protein]-cysteine S-methyltransferase